MWNVTIKPRAERRAMKMPEAQRKLLLALQADLRVSGPVQSEWPKYSKLGGNKHHCHLSYHWVACWEETETGVQIEVYYAGSRESAPY